MRVILKDIEIMKQVSAHINVTFNLSSAEEVQGVIGRVVDDDGDSWSIDWGDDWAVNWTKEFCIILGD